MYQTWSWLAFLHWPYPPEVVQRQFTRVADGWARGLERFRSGVALASGAARSVAEAGNITSCLGCSDTIVA